MINIEHQWKIGPVELPLPWHEVHVWSAALAQPEWVLEQLRSVLSAEELSRAEHFHFEKDRQGFISSHGILRLILGTYFQTEPRRLQFSSGQYGKPRLAGPLDFSPLRFSMSHSRDLALYAITCNRELGIDVEYIRPIADAPQIAARYFSRRESALLRLLPLGKGLEAFFHCWTRKEAYAKAVGTGLIQPLNTSEVSVEYLDETVQLLAIDGDPEKAARWSLQKLATTPGYAAALVVEGHDWHLSCWYWTPRA